MESNLRWSRIRWGLPDNGNAGRWRSSGYVAALLGVLYFCCDAIENIFIFVMLADRLGFPDLLAVVRSWIALVKYIFNFSSGFWAITAGIVLLIRKKS